MDLTLRLPDGKEIPGIAPVVIIGPNGSGKTRQVRNIGVPSGAPLTIVNALRNTRVTTEIPAMGLTSAKNNLTSQNAQARSQYWDLVSDFDMLLSRLHAEDAAAAIEFRNRSRSGDGLPDNRLSSMERLQVIWARVFPGRSLWWNDNIPMVRSTIPGSQPEYLGQYMSDGEKAALYLTGKVLVADPGVLVVDEPETHFHSLIAVELWNELEKTRDDLRLVYVTHDLPFALSRHGATFVLAHPTKPMRVLDALDDLPTEAAETLLGAASVSFFARRLVLCEGDLQSRDYALYAAWFNGIDTVVRPLGSCEMVIRSTIVLCSSSLVVGLETLGIIDRDFHSDGMLEDLPPGVVALTLHEVESVYCIPAVVTAVARHLGKASSFVETDYIARIRAAITDVERHKVIIERWKRRIEGPLLDLIGKVESRTTDLDSVIAHMPTVFDQVNWNFSPTTELAEEKARVEARVPDGTIEELLALMPGKWLISLVSTSLGIDVEDYCLLVNQALKGEKGLESLASDLEAALQPYLPPRNVPLSPVSGAEDETAPA